MNSFKKILLLAFMAGICNPYTVFGAKKTPKEMAELKAKALRAKAEAAKLDAEALAAELEAAQQDEQEAAPQAAAAAAVESDDEAEVSEEEEDSSADELASDMPKELDAAVVAFGQELQKFSGKETMLEGAIGQCFERCHNGHRHGHYHGHGEWRGGHHGKGAPGVAGGYNLTLKELIDELKKEANLSENKLLKRELIRWAWHIIRLKSPGADIGDLVKTAQVIIDKTPIGKGHNRIHGWHGRGGRPDGRAHDGPGMHGHGGPGHHGRGDGKGRRDGGRHGHGGPGRNESGRGRHWDKQ